MEDRLEQASHLIQAGRLQEARKLLEAIIKEDQHNTAAWQLYAQTWPRIADRRRILEIYLRMNPSDIRAQQAHAALVAEPPPEAAASASGQENLMAGPNLSTPASAAVESHPLPEPVPPPALPPAPWREKTVLPPGAQSKPAPGWMKFVGASFLMVIILGVILAVFNLVPRDSAVFRSTVQIPDAATQVVPASAQVPAASTQVPAASTVVPTGSAQPTSVSTQSQRDLAVDYFFYVPKAYSKDREWPLFIGLHGAGQTGRDCWNLWQPYADREGFILLCPSIPGEMGIDSQIAVEKIVWSGVDQVRKNYRLAPRAFLSGFGAGGFFVQGFAFHYPQAVGGISILSSGIYLSLGPEQKDIPILVVIGDRDDPSSIDASRQFVDSLKAIGFNIQYEVLPGVDHRVTDRARELTIALFRKTMGK